MSLWSIKHESDHMNTWNQQVQVVASSAATTADIISPAKLFSVLFQRVHHAYISLPLWWWMLHSYSMRRPMKDDFFIFFPMQFLISQKNPFIYYSPIYLWCCFELIWLVVGPPLWKILVNWKSIGMIIPNIWENKKCSKPPTSYKSQTWWFPYGSPAASRKPVRRSGRLHPSAAGAPHQTPRWNSGVWWWWPQL